MSTDLEQAEKTISELQSTCEALSRTISEQSETLENRGQHVKAVEQVRDQLLEHVEELERAHDVQLQKVDELTEGYERIKSEAMLKLQGGNDIKPRAFADALDTYALAVARISTTDSHPQIVVALVQMAKHIRELETIADIIVWLSGAQ
jgi:molecular chaperone GrpE (heat shock protein)